MASLFCVFSFVASRVSARRPSSFLLLRQKKRTKEKASLRQVRCAVPCAARTGRVWRKLGYASNMRQPHPPAAALLSPVSMACDTERRLLGCAIANSRGTQQPDSSSIASASNATRDTTRPACKVSASERARGLLTRSPLGRAEQRRVGRTRAGACLSEASLRTTPHSPSSARYPAGARHTARLSFVYFSLAKQRKVRRPPGRDPACHEHQSPRPPGQNPANHNNHPIPPNT